MWVDGSVPHPRVDVVDGLGQGTESVERGFGVARPTRRSAGYFHWVEVMNPQAIRPMPTMTFQFPISFMSGMWSPAR